MLMYLLSNSSNVVYCTPAQIPSTPFDRPNRGPKEDVIPRFTPDDHRVIIRGCTLEKGAEHRPPAWKIRR